MSKYSFNLSLYTTIPMILTLLMLFKNMFISVEIPMINMMSFYIPISIMLDWISCMFLSTVTFISSMIIMFSVYYIPSKEHKQFHMLLMMFVLSMMILILSDNIIFILLGWDGLGLSSYILVIYYQNFSSAASGTITILSNRIGDIMILLSISIMTMNSNWNFNMNKEFNLMIMTLLMIAACSKSAQFPFSAWLPAAMAAPTPISALVHSSTLVTAGVFLLIRIMNNMHPISMMMLMLVSSASTMYASMTANWEQDIKKIIALSTLSQISMMMFAISINSPSLAFFHLITHALFKSSMFLCAGMMIHNTSYQDMRMMGMNFFNSPLTLSILGISNMTLMALPFMSGFFSKDTIIELLLNLNLNSFISYMMIMSIGMTMTYSIRMSLLTNNQSLKSNPNIIIINSKHVNTPISIMMPSSIMMGTMLMWVINPEQMFIFPFNLKLSITMMMLLGVLFGVMLSFKSKKFIKMGESSISLWFIHYMTIISMKISSPMMMIILNNDKSWQESYGPQEMFNFNKKLSIFTNYTKTIWLLSLIMMFMIPIILN